MLSLFHQSGRRTGASVIKAVLILAAIGLGICLLLPMQRSAREAARRNACINKMKNLVLALHNYHDVYHVLPPAFTVDKNGKPLHSWRTLLLPYLEESRLFQSIDLRKPWDDSVNAKARNTAIDAFHCPSSDAPETHTNYVAILAPDSCIQPKRSLKLSEISDGISKTIILVEVPAERSVPWMAPEDIGEKQLLELLKAGTTNHLGGIFIVAIADGFVRSLPAHIDSQMLHELITATGNEDANLPE